MAHSFCGKWITDSGFADRRPRRVFHRQKEKIDLPPDGEQNCHILFRRSFSLPKKPEKATVFLTADDYYKLYVNGRFVSQGPTPGYHSAYPYHEIDLTDLLTAGKNCIAVHTYYQGLINRVWQSGDGRQGLLLDLWADGELLLASDTSFRTARHTGYTAIGKCGYDTQFTERYDSRAKEVGFSAVDYDDRDWENARPAAHDDHTVKAQKTARLVFEKIAPVACGKVGDVTKFDFGRAYVGYLFLVGRGQAGQRVCIRYGQELEADGRVRYKMRCNCVYADEWILSGGRDTFSAYDYKSFRYAEVEADFTVEEVYLIARHYPFSLVARMRSDYAENSDLCRIWDLCVHSQQYGVQEVIQDCMDREKGFYLGDGCYTALTHMILSGHDGITRKMIDEAFSTTFITEGMVTCLCCSFMQEIAEYPLMLCSLLLWHYRLTGDIAYLRENYKKAVRLLEAYRRSYEKDGLLCELDKWCVVEWPDNFRDGYAVDIREGHICHEAHVAINAYYIEAVQTVNKMAKILSLPAYREEAPLRAAFFAAFYDKEKHLFYDGTEHRHISYIGNVYPFAFRLCPDDGFKEAFFSMVEEKGMAGVSLFGSFALLCGMIREGEDAWVKRLLLDEGAWLRMLREGGSATYEGWGRDTKWNTSLFHLTLLDAAVFLSDTDLHALFA